MFRGCYFLTIAVSTFLLASACSVGKEHNPKDSDISIMYYSDNVTTLSVIYHSGDDEVTVRLPDGRIFDLPRAISGSGIRYTKDDKLVFNGEEKSNH